MKSKDKSAEVGVLKLRGIVLGVRMEDLIACGALKDEKGRSGGIGQNQQTKSDQANLPIELK